MKKNILKIFFMIFILFLCSDVKAEPVNPLFDDDNLYKCVIDAYNDKNETSEDYTYNISDEDLRSISVLNCSSYKGLIDSLTGLDNMTGLTELNVSGNTFLGTKITLNIGSSNAIKSSLVLPSQLTLSNINYTVTNSKVIKVANGIVTGLSGGSAYINMTAKIGSYSITEKYLVVVNSTEVKSDNGNLSYLSLSSGTLDFKSNIKKYSVMVPNKVSVVSISAVLESTKASFVEGFGPRDINLKVGTNTIYIKVKAEDDSVNIYTIGIIRSDGTDSNNLLSNIELSVGELDFKSDVSIYTFSVAYEVEKITVTPVTESLLSTTKVSDTNLKVGENKITITVTSENGNEKVYELIVNREEYESKNNYLSSLIITNYPIEFVKDKNEYTLTIKGESILKISATPEKITSGVSVIGNKNLKNNSEIKIKVTDKDNLTREYILKIKKSFVYNLSLKEYFLFLEFATIIGLVIYLIKPKNKKKVIKKNKYVLNNKVCKNCGTINNPRSNTCYVCGRELN